MNSFLKETHTFIRVLLPVPQVKGWIGLGLTCTWPDLSHHLIIKFLLTISIYLSIAMLSLNLGPLMNILCFGPYILNLFIRSAFSKLKIVKL